MPQTKPKKIRIYKLASEYNLSAESLVEFLRKKGHKVKSHMSILNDEMISDIHTHFKKDIEKAEKHYKKLAEFQKKMSEKTDKDERSAKLKKEEAEQKEAEKAEAEVKRLEEEKSSEPEEEKSAESKKSGEENLEQQPETPSEKIVAEKTEEKPKETKKPEETPDEPEDNKTDGAVAPTGETDTEPTDKTETIEKMQEEEIQQKDSSVYKTRTEEDIKKAKGLKVLGKIDLDDKKKKTTKKDDTKKDQEKAVTDKANEDTKDTKQDAAAKTGALSEEDKAKKKKKRKKSRKKKNEPESTDKAKRKGKTKRFEIDEKEVKESIRITMLSMEDSGAASRASQRKKKKKERLEQEEKLQERKELEKKKIEVTEYIAVSELANLMGVPVNEVISKCISLGLMVSINQRLDVETITLVADEFGIDVEFREEYTSEALEDEEDPPESLKPRSPVVTIMGHVDHGKTSLLDYIRRENVVAGESGGITQHIGAYRVELEEGKTITFLDTPGHEAFTAMRARGAQVTDIVVLIVAADDAVMPQTIEAINHAQAAGVPIVVAINKIDKPNSSIDRIKQQLADKNVLVEDWGGKYQSVEVSAKMGTNIDVLLEKILLEAELLELKSNPDRKARGIVIESELDRGRGVTSTILVQKGTLKVGDPFVAGVFHGRIRAMFDERNNKVEEAGPSVPVLALGFEGAPQAGDSFVVVDGERLARETALKRQQLKREQDHKQIHHITLDDISQQISQGEVKDLPIIVKGDVDGSVEALSDSLMKLSNSEVNVKVIHRGVGAITETDVYLADASNAIIIGFHVRPHLTARKLAENQKVDIRIYNVIYDAINEVKAALEGMLSPIISEEIVCTLDVRDIFKVPKVGTVAGCYVQEGKITRNTKIRLIRDGIVIFDGELSSLKRFKDDVKEVDTGYECGLSIQNFNDIKVGDVIEGYKLVETKKTLA